MRDQLTQYVHLLFAGTSESEEIQQEILQNTLDRYDDLICQGKSPEAAYRLAIAGIGDINEILGSEDSPASVANTDIVVEQSADQQKKKSMRAVAIALYICCVIPVIALANIADGIIGLCVMFVIIAIATVLIILASSGNKQKEEEKAEPRDPVYKAYKSLSGAITLAIYLLVSFWSGAWHITWLIFPISGAVDGIVKAIFDLKEAKKHET